MDFFIEVSVLVSNKCRCSILLVYTTSVDIDQDLLSLMSQPHNMVRNIYMSDVYMKISGITRNA